MINIGCNTRSHDLLTTLLLTARCTSRHRLLVIGGRLPSLRPWSAWRPRPSARPFVQRSFLAPICKLLRGKGGRGRWRRRIVFLSWGKPPDPPTCRGYETVFVSCIMRSFELTIGFRRSVLRLRSRFFKDYDVEKSWLIRTYLSP